MNKVEQEQGSKNFKKKFENNERFLVEVKCLENLCGILPVPVIVSKNYESLELITKDIPGIDLRSSFNGLSQNDKICIVRNLGAYLKKLHSIDNYLQLRPISYTQLFSGLEQLEGEFNQIKEILLYTVERYMKLSAKYPIVPTHGDFQDKNLIALSGRLTGVIDWENAELGHPYKELTLQNIFCYEQFSQSEEAKLQEAILDGYQIGNRRLFYERVPLYRLFDIARAIALPNNWINNVGIINSLHLVRTSREIWRQIKHSN